MNDKVTVSVVIPHYNDLVALDLCLSLLSKQSTPADEYEIIVADNNSKVGSEAVSAVVKNRAKLIVVSEQGAGPARNGGVAASRGKILAFIDSDCQPHPDWISEGVSALREYDFVGGRVDIVVQDAENMTSAEAFEKVFAFDFENYIKRKGFTGSGNLFCGRNIFEQVGGFRAGVSEDVDWSHRARAAGFRLGYAPRSIVGHPARQTWEELHGKWVRMNRESFNLLSGKPLGRIRWLVRSLSIPFSIPYHIPKILTSSRLTSFRQRMAAVSMLIRIRTWRTIDALQLLWGGRG
jgi:glycosyltransferase involved in cell wall biosynthesis